MNIEELKKSGRIIYEATSGSIAYGTSCPTSDKDIRGYYWTPKSAYISLFTVKPQINDEKNDIIYYNLARAFELLKTANPNCIELLWIPQDCISIFKSPIMDELFANRYLFISKKAYYTHAEYAFSQIKRAKGCNKRVHNPQPEKQPLKEDFCWIIDMKDKNNFSFPFCGEDIYRFPCRPIALIDSRLNLNEYHVSSLEHVPNVYRLYYYENGKGVFRGNDFLTCASIPKDEEKSRFRGLLIFNKEEYERAVKEWHQYWDWVKNRNEARWVDQENGILNYDQKNMMHCVRLMLSAEHILTHGEPIVRFEGDMRDYLMNIRYGKFTYEEIMDKVQFLEKNLKKLFEVSKIPENVDMDKLENLYKKLMNIGEEMAWG
jgi:predicted nucleotidyltransferase